MSDVLENASNFMLLVHPVICAIIVLLFSRDKNGEIKVGSPIVAFLICFIGGFVFFWTVFMRDGFGLGMVASEGEEALSKSLLGIITGSIISILPYLYLGINYLDQKKPRTHRITYNTEDILDSDK